MSIETLLTQLNNAPETVSFEQAISTIEEHYVFTPTSFKNGNTSNEANTNNGSCKILAFGKIHQLTEEKTLALFGDYYRKDVLENPSNDDHQNIRQFMQFGWPGVVFSSSALVKKDA